MTQDLITDLSSALDGPEEPLAQAAAVLRRAFAVDRVSVARFEAGLPRFEIAAAAGADLLAPGTVLPVSTCSYFAQVAHGQAFREGDFDRSPDFDLPLDGVVRAAGFHAGCSVPLRAGGRTVGAVSLSAATRREDMDDAAARLATLGDLLGRAVAPRPPAARPARVLVLHADALVGRGLARLAERDRAAAATVAASPDEAAAAAAAEPPDVVVCDVWTGGHRVDEVARALRDAGVLAPLLVVSAADAADAIHASRLAGAAGYLPRGEALTGLAGALAAVRAGTARLGDLPPPAGTASPGAGASAGGEAPAGLTPREAELLGALEEGLRFKQVALRLGISESTAKTHGRNLFRKLGATSRAEAVHAARERGLLA